MMPASIEPSPNLPATRLLPVESAVDAVRGLAPGGRIVGVTKGQFSLLDLIEAVLTHTGPAAVTVSTWTPGRAEMERVIDMLRHRRIESFRLLVDRSFPTRQPQYMELIRRLVPASEIRMTRTHAKFALITAGDWRVTIRTSMNFNANPRFEQFDLDDDAEIYGFFDGLVESLFDHIPAGIDVPSRTINTRFTTAIGATGGRRWR